MIKQIGCIAVLLSGAVQAAYAEEPVAGQSGFIVKFMGAKDTYYGMVGLGEYDVDDKNMGYVAVERYGAYKSGSDHFQATRYSLKGDAYASPDEQAEYGFSGAKIDIYYGQSEMGDYDWSGVGLGLGIVWSPIPALKSLYITPGIDYESKYLSGNWNSDQSAQFNWYVDLEYYPVKQFALTAQYASFRRGDLFSSEGLEDYLVFGFRWFI